MKNFVITIARGFGSGGKQIGLKIAGDLNIKLMDKELLELASIESGISEELFALADEKLNRRLLMHIPDREHYGNVLRPENRKFVSDMNLFNYQVKILRSLAKTESFIVMGKAANFVMRDLPNVISVQIQAPFEDCVKQIMERSVMTEEQAARAVRRTDKYRSDYHRYYTGQKWTDGINFDLCLNSSRIGWDGCAEVIKESVCQKLGLTREDLVQPITAE
ncbi:MAG: cytidylate kinase-like family protein [Eubacteriales bacterium]|nr:cytidylate kinase-like family protein [Eubacteriales bacterium]